MPFSHERPLEKAHSVRNSETSVGRQPKHRGKVQNCRRMFFRNSGKKTATGVGRLPEVRKVWKPSPVRQLQEGKVLRSEVPEGRLESPQEELQQVDRKEENS
jgi:hypothetical protein